MQQDVRIGHLQLTRRVGEAVVLTVGDVQIVVKIDSVESGRATVRITAPRCVDIARRSKVLREEAERS